MFELDQNWEEPFVIPGGRLSNGLLDFSMLCSGDISPSMADMTRYQQELIIPNCVMPAFTTLELEFQGSVFRKRISATYDVDSLEIRAYYPDVWCVDEQVTSFLTSA